MYNPLCSQPVPVLPLRQCARYSESVFTSRCYAFCHPPPLIPPKTACTHSVADSCPLDVRLLSASSSLTRLHYCENDTYIMTRTPLHLYRSTQRLMRYGGFQRLNVTVPVCALPQPPQTRSRYLITPTFLQHNAYSSGRS